MSAPHDSLLDALDPQVVSYTRGNYNLGYDLRWIDHHRTQGAIEATVIHSTRALEVLVKEAMARSHIRATLNLNDNLNQLRSANLLERNDVRWLHRLRELGNDARHALRVCSSSDADLGFIVLLKFLRWYFCDFDHGLQLQTLTVPNQPLNSLLPTYLAELIDQLDRADLSGQEFLATLELNSRECKLLVTPLLPAVLVERLLEREHYNQAQRILSIGLNRFRGDLRLSQLLSLLHSSKGELEQAQRILEAIPLTDSPDDEETLGILAGLYKRMWKKDPKHRPWLELCRETYRQGWILSNEANTYLGINAAYTALCLGEDDQARRLGERIAALLESRRTLLREHGQRSNYWDLVTLGEANLYLRRFSDASACYLEAFPTSEEQKRNLDVARTQAREVLKRLGEDPDAYEFLKE